MTLNETLAALSAAGSEKIRKTYARHGVTREMFGVSYADLEKLRKKIKIDQQLAEGLWDSGNHDARVLAAMIADPAKASPRSLARWMKDLDHSLIVCGAARLAANSPSAKACFEEWSKSPADHISSAGWMTFAALAGSNDEIADSYFEQQLARIEKNIKTAKNETKYAMNGALIAIGIRNPKLEKQAIAAAKRIGKVEVDHGDTACETPDAIAYIKKAVARKKAKR